MTGFQEPDPDLVTPNPGGEFDPLGESILTHDWAPLRILSPIPAHCHRPPSKGAPRGATRARLEPMGSHSPSLERWRRGGAVARHAGHCHPQSLMPPVATAMLCHIAHAVCAAIHALAWPRCPGARPR